MDIPTVVGPRRLVRRFGIAGEYAETTPRPSAPFGEFWTFNPQKGWVPCPSNSPGLQAAKEIHNGKI